jgi:hypothetical protein
VNSKTDLGDILIAAFVAVVFITGVIVVFRFMRRKN